MPASRLLILIVVLASMALPAFAATPSDGTVSNATPKVEWKGTVTGGGATAIPAVANGGTGGNCFAPSCDTFALTVADSATLVIQANCGNFTMVEVVKPDSSTIYNGGAQDSETTTVKISKAPTGKYSVRISCDALDSIDFTAFAQLGSAPAAAATPVAGATPGPGPTPAAGTTAHTSPTLSITTRKGSAKKFKQGVTIALRSSGPVTQVVTQLRKGKKVLASATLASLNGTGKVKLKAKKLKRGAYVLNVAAKDPANGATVGTSVPFKVAK